MYLAYINLFCHKFIISFIELNNGVYGRAWFRGLDCWSEKAIITQLFKSKCQVSNYGQVMQDTLLTTDLPLS